MRSQAPKSHKIERNATIVAMRDSGYSYAEIARQHNLSTTRVRQIYLRDSKEAQ